MRRDGRVLRALATVLTTALVVWVVSFVALWVYAGPDRASERREIIIKDGAGELIAAGENALEIPSTWDFKSGDVLVLDNRDSTVHVVGPWTVGPGQVIALDMKTSVTSAFCSIHPSGQLAINVAPRRSELSLTVWSALLIGVPLGLAIVIVRRVLAGLEEPEPHP